MVHIPRTDVENGALAVFRSISNSYKMEKAQKKDKPCDLSFLVDHCALTLNPELVPNLYASQALLDYLTSVGIEVPDQL